MQKLNWKIQRNWTMKTQLISRSLAALMAVSASAALAADLNALDVATLPGDRVELKLTFDEPVTAPRGYTIDQPARIALDLPGVSNKLKNKHQELGSGNTRSVTVVEAQQRTRVIINLTSLTSYNTRVEGNNLYVVVGEGVTRNEVQAPAQVTKPAVVAGGRAVRNIDF